MNTETGNEERQRRVAERLKDFRQLEGITRAHIAIGLSVGSERLASYESGRAPLRYEVYREYAREFRLHPHWLATGIGPTKLPIPYSDAAYSHLIKPKDLFLDVWDAVLSGRGEPYYTEPDERLFQVTELMKDLHDLISKDPAFLTRISPAIVEICEDAARALATKLSAYTSPNPKNSKKSKKL